MGRNHINANTARGILQDRQTEEVTKGDMGFHLMKRNLFKFAVLNVTSVFLTMETSKGIELPIPTNGRSNATSVERRSKLRMT